MCQTKVRSSLKWNSCVGLFAVVLSRPGGGQRSEVSVSVSAAVQRSQASGCRLISNLTVKQPAGLKSALINPAYWVRLDFALLRLSVCVSAFELTVI